MQSWRRTFWAIWFSNLVAGMGMMSILPFFPGHLESLGVSERASLAVWTGLVYGAAPFSAALASPLWGALGDQLGRRLMVLRSMVALCLFVGAMAFVTAPWQLLVLRIVQGLFSGFFAPSMTLVSALAPEDSQGRAASSLQAALVWGAILGPILGAAVRSWTTLEAVYLVVAGLSALAALVVLVSVENDRPPPRERQAQEPRRSARQVLAGSFGDLGDLGRSRELRGAVVLLFWIQFGLGSTNPQLELYVRDLPAHWWVASAAAPFSVLAAANLLALRYWGNVGDRRGHRRALDRCALATGLALLLHAVTPSYELLLAARALLGVAAAGAGPLAFGVAAAETVSDRRGGAIGVVFSARALAVALSAGIGGWLSGRVGIPALFACGGLVVLLSGLLLRNGPDADPGEIE